MLTDLTLIDLHKVSYYIYQFTTLFAWEHWSLSLGKDTSILLSTNLLNAFITIMTMTLRVDRIFGLAELVSLSNVISSVFHNKMSNTDIFQIRKCTCKHIKELVSLSVLYHFEHFFFQLRLSFLSVQFR